MNTFNNLNTATGTINWDADIDQQLDWASNRSVEQQMEAIGKLGIIIPTMSRADANKVNKLTKMGTLKTLKYAIARCEFTTSERLQTLLDLADRLTKLNAGVLQGGSELKAALLETVWLVYAKVESQGIANDHYQQTDIPVDDRQTLKPNKLQGVCFHYNGKRPALPDSKLDAESQYLALAIADRIHSERPVIGQPVSVKGDATPCTEHGQPISQMAPDWFGGFTVEKVTGGHGSGLPFEPIAKVIDEPQPTPINPAPERFDSSARSMSAKGARIWPVNPK